MILGLLLTFYLISPSDYGGLEYASIGLAIKMVVIQFIIVNVQLWYNTKFLDLSFIKFFGHQFLCLILLLIVSYISRIFSSYIFINEIYLLIISAFIYFSFTLLIVIIFPKIISINRLQLNRLLFIKN